MPTSIFARSLQTLIITPRSLRLNATVSGFDHASLGARVAGNWRFSETVKAAIGYHHNSVDYRGEAIMIVRCVEVANLICT